MSRNEVKVAVTMGSLFDGIGGFPLAGICQGFVTLWASEIEPFPIGVTKVRLPDMQHLGDITLLNGAMLPPVDVICGGSPCQDLSVANCARRGLAGSRSGLFMEQLRIVREMREEEKRCGRAALDVRPRYMVWENVPGAFSSAEGEDFRAVLEETARIADSTVSVPRPAGGVWYAAGCIMGDQFSIAWRVLDAQYWGVPQRRRRIFLVADFSGQTAPEILFEQERLLGHFAPISPSWQGAPTGAGICLDTAVNVEPPLLCINDQGGNRMDITENVTTTLRANMGGHQPSVLCLCDQGGSIMSCSEDIVGTLRAQEHGHQPLVLADRREAAIKQSYCIAGNNIDRSDHNGGNGYGFQPNISYTVTTNDRHAVCQVESYRQTVGALCRGDEKGTGHQYVEQGKCIVDRQNNVYGQSQYGGYKEGCTTLRAQGGDNGGGSENLVAELREQNQRLVRRLVPMECERLQGFPDGWTAVKGASDSARYKALGNSVAIPCVEYVLRGIAYFLSKNREAFACTSTRTT